MIVRSKTSFNLFLAIFVISFYASSTIRLQAESGYDLWLRYAMPSNKEYANELANAFAKIEVHGDSKTMAIVRDELSRAKTRFAGNLQADDKLAGTVLVGTPSTLPAIHQFELEDRLSRVGAEGYVIASVNQEGHPMIIVAANTDIGALYGTFELLRLAMTGQALDTLNINEQPAIHRRVLDHWDNLDGTVERGYAGDSLWKWNDLPSTLDPRYQDYARANASLGINGVVLNNQANAAILTSEYLLKAAALADCFRPYGIRIYLSADFGAPLPPSKTGDLKAGGIGTLTTADPADPAVRAWWSAKVDEIYKVIPDFGGFIVKADSEGTPGPNQYGRTFADGANMLADALAPHGGVVMWRAFVYAAEVDPDRAKRSYVEFQPLDGKFHRNVFVQVKNGPMDFQPDEPVHPLFGAMPQTPLVLELQITQEYLGHANALVYLAPMWSKVLNTDTWAQGAGSTVARMISRNVKGQNDSGICGVSNTGTDTNWCGSDFAQANWYAFGRLAWNPALTPESIAREWIKQTWTDDPQTITIIDSIMEESWPAIVDYTTPLGLQFTMASKDHYSPDPQGRVGKLWNADKNGIGYNRSKTGSDYVDQYQAPVSRIWNSLDRCPEDELLFYHYVPWDHHLQSGRTVIGELDFRFNNGADAVAQFEKRWQTLNGKIDPERYARVDQELTTQISDARHWRDTYVAFFHEISRL
ncbi:MAG TPA: alpha-glucuronidase family glycosyl hydrolase [Verrucomicrobiae bacterium]